VSPAMSSQCADHGQPMHPSLGMDWHCTSCAVIPVSDPPPAGPAVRPRPFLAALLSPFTMRSEPDVATPPPKDAWRSYQMNFQHL